MVRISTETGIFSRPSQEYLTLFFIFGVYLIPPFEKEFVIPTALALDYPTWIIFFDIILIDIVGFVLVSLNFDPLEKIPSSEISSANSWKGRVAFTKKSLD